MVGVTGRIAAQRYRFGAVRLGMRLGGSEAWQRVADISRLKFISGKIRAKIFGRDGPPPSFCLFPQAYSLPNRRSFYSRSPPWPHSSFPVFLPLFLTHVPANSLSDTLQPYVIAPPFRCKREEHRGDAAQVVRSQQYL